MVETGLLILPFVDVYCRVGQREFHSRSQCWAKDRQVMNGWLLCVALSLLETFSQHFNLIAFYLLHYERLLPR